VAVRVRPFIGKEVGEQSENCLKISANGKEVRQEFKGIRVSLAFLNFKFVRLWSVLVFGFAIKVTDIDLER
jgi:hypothetical protein